MKTSPIICIAALSLALIAPVAAWAADSESAPASNATSADFAAGKAAVEQKKWQLAADSFKRATQKDSKSADA